MNIVNKLTLRHLHLNKKRTLITLIGVIISVAMITGVVTLGISFLDLMKRETISNSGNWHVKYMDVNAKQLAAIEANENSEEVTVSKDLGFSKLEGSKNRNKPYLFIKEYNEAGLHNFPVTLKQGRLPKQEGEVVISEDISKKGGVDYKIGSQLNLQIGQRYSIDTESKVEKLDQTYNIEWDANGKAKEQLVPQITGQYKVVGVIESPNWEPSWSPGYTVISYLNSKSLSTSETVDAYVILQNVKTSLFHEAELFAKKEQIGTYDFNSDLLRYYGAVGNDEGRKMLYSLTSIILGIIVIGSVSLIYNAFAISVSERSRHLGMLSSVGATSKQKRNSVFFESMVIGAISIPIGIICGILGIGVTFLWINTTMQDVLSLTESFQLVLSPLAICGAAAISILTIFISAYLPARRAAKVSPIDAIRQTADIKLTGKAVKTSKLTRKIFGIEGEIGLKNLKRNKRRYQATVFSLVISMVLFLGVSYFATILQQSMSMTQSAMNYDVMVSMNGEIPEATDLLASTILNMEQVNRGADELHFCFPVPKGSSLPSINLYALDEKALRDYAKEIGADADELMNPEKMAAIAIDPVTYLDMNAQKYVSKKTIDGKQGDKRTIYYDHRVDGKERIETTALGEVSLAYFTEKLPMGVQTMYSAGEAHLVVSKEVFQKLVYQSEETIQSITPERQIFLNSDNPTALQESIEALQENEISIFNVHEMRKQESQLMLLMGVFVYGFIILITAICVANIFNTISTSVALRKREFAMLKSVGMTPEGFGKMIRYESIFYGLKAILYGLPISILIMLLFYKTYMINFDFPFSIPWRSVVYAVLAVFLIVGMTMLYSSNKRKKESIIDGLKQENI